MIASGHSGSRARRPALLTIWSCRPRTPDLVTSPTPTSAGTGTASVAAPAAHAAVGVEFTAGAVGGLIAGQERNEAGGFHRVPHPAQPDPRRHGPRVELRP